MGDVSVPVLVHHSERPGRKQPFRRHRPGAVVLPSELLKKKTSSLDEAKATNRLEISSLLEAVDEMHRSVTEQSQRNCEKQRVFRGKTTVKANFAVGDFVLVAVRHRAHKLALKWTDPRRVILAGDQNVFRVQHILTMKERDVRACRLKFYRDSALNVTERLKEHILDHDDTEFIAEDFLRLDRAAQDDSLISLVKWKGFDEDDNSWEPTSNLVRAVPDRLREWLLQQQRTKDIDDALRLVPTRA